MSAVTTQVWFWLILVYLILELVSLFCYHESWIVMIVGRFLEMLKHTIDEVSSLKGRQALCGALVTACLLSILIPIIHGFSLAVTSDTALPLISGCAVLAFVLTALTVLVYLNLRY